MVFHICITDQTVSTYVCVCYTHTLHTYYTTAYTLHTPLSISVYDGILFERLPNYSVAHIFSQEIVVVGVVINTVLD